MTNQVEINSRNMNVTSKIEEYITKRASRLDRFLNGIDEARVDLAYAKTARNASDRRVAQITVRGKKFILRSEERADDIFIAFDRALDKIQRQIERYKGKRYRSRGNGKSFGEMVTEDLANEELMEFDESAPEIVRRKRFGLVPMDEMEAIEQMELLGHESFFVFFNINTNGINVLYKRRDGKFGLIEPELG